VRSVSVSRPPRACAAIKHEIRARLAGQLGSAIDQASLIRLDPQIEGCQRRAAFAWSGWQAWGSISFA